LDCQVHSCEERNEREPYPCNEELLAVGLGRQIGDGKHWEEEHRHRLLALQSLEVEGSETVGGEQMGQCEEVKPSAILA
jgi:hypothetical protein